MVTCCSASLGASTSAICVDSVAGLLSSDEIDAWVSAALNVSSRVIPAANWLKLSIFVTINVSAASTVAKTPLA